MSRLLSTRTAYFTVYGALLLLLLATVLVARLHLGLASLVLSLSIALIKVLLIAVVFMHLNHEPPLIRLTAVAGLFWLSLLFVFLACDYGARPIVP